MGAYAFADRCGFLWYSTVFVAANANQYEFGYVHHDVQQIAEPSSLLVKNATICWDHLYLERRIGSTDPAVMVG